MRLDEVRQFALLETSYRERDASEAVRTLIDEGAVGRVPARGPLHRGVAVWLVSDAGTTLLAT